MAKKKISVKKSELNINYETKRTFSCSQCAYATISSRNYYRHLRSHTGGKGQQRSTQDKCKNRHQCHMCSYSSTDSGNVRRHMDVHKITMRKCESCNYSTYSRNALREHFKKVHGVSVRSTCKYCKGDLTSIRDVRLHQWQNLRANTSCKEAQSHENKAEKICSVKLIDIRVKSRKRLFYCNICGKMFARSSFLRRHKDVFHTTRENIHDNLKEGQSESGNQFADCSDDLYEEQSCSSFDLKSNAKCKFCQVLCKNEIALINHLKRHSSLSLNKRELDTL